MAGKPEDRLLWYSLQDFLGDHSLAEDENYQYVLSQIDMDSYLDLVLLGIYSANQDWPANNVRFWRVREPVQTGTLTPTADGRWRWLINDLDVAFYAPDFNLYDLLMVASDTWPAPSWSTILFRRLMEQEDFRTRFLARLDFHLNDTFSESVVLEWIDYWQEELKPEMGLHIQRWQRPATLESWQSNVEEVRDFVRDRPAYLRRQTEELFDLTGSHKLTVDLSNGRGGDVRVHNILLDGKQDLWEGQFFAGTKIDLEAFPQVGYEFVGWVDENDAAINGDSLILTADMKVHPVFNRKFWAELPVILIALLLGGIILVSWLKALIRRKQKRAHGQLLWPEDEPEQ